MQIAWRVRVSRPSDDTQERQGIQPAAGDLDDLTLVRMTQADPDAFGYLYERYEPIVYHFCLRRLSNPDLAADATSTIFTRALTGLPRYKRDPKHEGSTFRSWLFTIAYNVVVDSYRRRRPDISLDQHGQTLRESPHLVDPGDSPEERVIAADDARRFRAVLRCLPDRQRAIVELRLAGLTGAEIARALTMTESAVKSAQFRAYGTLRDLLRDDRPTTESVP